MVSADAQTDLSIDLEAAGRREEAKRGRAERVGRREYDAAVVDALAIRGGWGAGEGEVPFEEVGFEGSGMKGWVWVGG